MSSTNVSCCTFAGPTVATRKSPFQGCAAIAPVPNAKATARNLLIDNRAASILDAQLVGQYAINFQSSDGHHTGLFRFEHLRKLDPQEETKWGKPEESLIRQG